MWCSLLITFLNLAAGNCLPRWSLCILFPNLPQGYCRQGVQVDCTCSETSSREQSAGCILFYSFQTFLHGTVCRVLQTVYKVKIGLVIECLTRDRGVVGSRLTGVTALWSLSKSHLS